MKLNYGRRPAEERLVDPASLGCPPWYKPPIRLGPLESLEKWLLGER
jgi:hypothetical protein